MPSAARLFQSHLDDGDLRQAMKWLNSTVPYRYSAVFAFHGDTLRSVCLVDKHDDSVSACPDQPIMESYCIYVRRTDAAFNVEAAKSDERVDGHPKQALFQSYYGVPLLSAEGKTIGTVCHFDADPVKVPGSVVDDLDDLAPLISSTCFDAASNNAPLKRM